jgi:hypothetical protein
MADNVAVTAGSGTNIAADDISSVFYQRVKLSLGADGTAVDAVAGAGAVGTGVQRVTLASDDPAVALLGTIDTDTGAMVTDLAAIEVLLGTIDADTGGILTAVQLLDNAISGSEMQVDVVAALPAGTNSIGAVTNTHLTNALVGDYETVAASQTAQTLGATGATGDYLSGVLIVPATTSPGNVIILDNATSITIFTGGAASVSNLVPFMVPLGMLSVSGAWKITTGANVSAIGIGNFT